MEKQEGSRSTPRTSAVLIVGLLVVALVAFCSTGRVMAQGAGDDFNDNSKDAAKWGTDTIKGGGALIEQNGHLEYIVKTASAEAYSIRPWALGKFPVNADWEAEVDVENDTTPAKAAENDSFGLKVRHPRLPDTEIEIELGAFGPDGPLSMYRQLGVIMNTNDRMIGGSGGPSSDTLTSARFRLSYNHLSKVVTAAYKIAPADWVVLGTFGISLMGGGVTANNNWSLTSSDYLEMTLYGYSEKMSIKPGTLYGDNFSETGEAILRDFAVTKITAPKLVPITIMGPSVTKQVKVQIQNRSPLDETINTLDGLVTLTAESLGACSNAPVTLHAGKPNKTVPFVLKKKLKMDLYFDVVLDCASDYSKGSGHEDYKFTATVHRNVLDGLADVHATDDTCPRSVTPPYLVDPYPDGKLKDKGCGGAKGDGTFGADVKTDVYLK